jgi:hypothetical protein
MPDPCRVHAAPMPFLCRSPAMPCRVNSHVPCRVPAIFKQCRVLRESPRGSRKYPNCWSYSWTDWYASDNNLRGTPHGSRKKPNAGRSPTCRLWTADANSRIPCHAYSTPMQHCAVALRSQFRNSMVVAWHGRSMVCVNQTRPHCLSKMGNTQSKPLAARHGRDMGTTWYCELTFSVDFRNRGRFPSWLIRFKTVSQARQFSNTVQIMLC